MRKLWLIPITVLMPLTSGARAQTIDTLPNFSSLKEGQYASLVIRTRSMTPVPAQYRHFFEMFPDGQHTAGQLNHFLVGQSGSGAAQEDVRNSWADGYVRQAEITIKTPAYAANAADAKLILANGGSGGTPINLGNSVPVGTINLTVTTPTGSPLANVDWATAYAAAHTTWRAGPVASEAITDSPVTGGLHVKQSVYVNADGTFGDDVTFANDQTFATGAGNIAYTATIKVGDNTCQIVIPANIPQAGFTKPHVFVPSNGSGCYDDEPKFWSGISSGVSLGSAASPSNNVTTMQEIIPNFDIWEQLGLLPWYPLNVGVEDSVIQGQLEPNNINQSGTQYDLCQFLYSCALRRYFGTTGGRPDIGLIPFWDESWVLTGNQSAYMIMMQMGDAAGSIPWHVNNGTDTQINLLDQNNPAPYGYSNFWALTDNCSNNYYGPCQTMRFAASDTAADWANSNTSGIQTDNAHQPQMGLMAYLSTGSNYYYQEVLDQAGMTVDSTYPAGNRFAYAPAGFANDDIVTGQGTQIRAGAWSLRDLDNALMVVQDNDPTKTYLSTVLTDNLNWVAQDAMNVLGTTYFANGGTKGQAQGWLDGDLHESKGNPPGYYLSSGWQNDYLALTLVKMAQETSPQSSLALAALSNMIPFEAGRFTQAPSVFSPYDGDAYFIVTWQGQTDVPLTTWSAIEQATIASGYSNTTAPFGPPPGTEACADYDNAAEALLKQMALLFPSNTSVSAGLTWQTTNISGCNNGNWDIGFSRGAITGAAPLTNTLTNWTP